MKILLKFELNNIWYFVCEDNNKIIYYFLKEGKKCFDLSMEQKLLVEQVIKRILPSNNRMQMPSYKLNGITYDVTLDKKTDFYYFNPIPSLDDMIFLNRLFNDEDECLMTIDRKVNDKSNNEKEPFIKKIFYVGKLLITAFISMSMVIYMMSSCDNSKYYHSVQATSQLSDEVILSTINDAIESNDGLSDEEKALFFDNAWVILDNKEYLDLDYIGNTFTNISIRYVPEDGKDNMAGVYNPVKNEITFYRSSSIDDVIDYVATHELYHAATRVSFEHQNSFLMETINTIFNEEYSGNSEKSIYTNYTNYTKVLMELIGSSPLKAYHNYSSIDPIVDALFDIIGDKVKAIKLLNCLNEYKKIYDYLSIIDNDAYRYQEMSDNLDVIENEIRSLFEEYYYAKYGFSIYDDLVMLYYLNPLELMNRLGNDIVLEDNQTIQFNFSNNIIYFNTQKMNQDNGIDVKIIISELVTTTYYDSVIGREKNRYFSYHTIDFKINDDNRYPGSSKIVRS